MSKLRTFLAAALLAPASFAGGGPQTAQVCYNDSIPFQFTNWSSSVSIPKFDPTLGDLVSIEFQLQAQVRGSARAESLDNSPTTVNTQFAATITLTRPDLSLLVVSVPVANFTDNFTAFDGVIDFGGTSGVTHANILANDMQSVMSPPPASDLVLFTGAGNIVLPVTAAGNSMATGSGNLITQFSTEAEALVRVCYNYLPNTPPVLVCPPTQMASVGVPLNFQICASDVDPGELVTLNVTGLPAGATTNPALPVVGNPACVDVSWTPGGAQTGNFVVSVSAIDQHGRSSTCTFEIISAECHLLMGPGFGSSQQTIFGHTFDTQLVAMRAFWPVTMNEMPVFRYDSLPVVTHWQLLMYNPPVFPQNDSQWSKTMRVTKNPNGTLSVEYLGTRNGIGMRAQTYWENGVRYVRFPFGIDGM
jgi:hypothetical protein